MLYCLQVGGDDADGQASKNKRYRGMANSVYHCINIVYNYSVLAREHAQVVEHSQSLSLSMNSDDLG